MVLILTSMALTEQFQIPFKSCFANFSNILNLDGVLYDQY